MKGSGLYIKYRCFELDNRAPYPPPPLLQLAVSSLRSYQVSILNQFTCPIVKLWLVPVMDSEQAACVLGKLLCIYFPQKSALLQLLLLS